MTRKVAKRGLVPPFIVMDVLRAANEREMAGAEVLHLEVGQPGTGAPAKVLAAARAAIDSDRLGYTEAFGLTPLRQRIARHYADVYAVDVDWSRVVVCTGSSSGFVLAFLSAFDAGDRVALASPGYPAYCNILRALGIEPAIIAVGTETNFQPTPELLDRIADPLDGLIVASPSNPTGTMIHRAELKRLCEYCRGRGIRLVSDEIYHGITYGERAETALRFDDEAIIVNSFSKYFSMTGWRLGWMVAPASLVRAIECLAQNFYISPPTLSQYGGLAVFDCTAELDENVVRYARNRAILLAELPKAGFRKMAPAEGAFYVYADVGDMTNDSAEFCRRMLLETGVAATPGIDFDPDRGHRFVRFSFAGSTEHITLAAQRLIAWRR